MSFSENGFEVVRNVISNQLLENLKIQFEMLRKIKFYFSKEKNDYAFGDPQSPNSFSVYSALFFESLSLQLKDEMEEITKVSLYPTYTYARIYYKGAKLDPHKDRPSCEYSTTVCIDSDKIWDFHILDRFGKEHVLKLNPGDMCVYSGCELLHWRNLYEGNCQMQCFLHYVNSSGKYKKFKYDKREIMGIGTKILPISEDIKSTNKISYF